MSMPRHADLDVAQMHLHVKLGADLRAGRFGCILPVQSGLPAPLELLS